MKSIKLSYWRFRKWSSSSHNILFTLIALTLLTVNYLFIRNPIIQLVIILSLIVYFLQRDFHKYWKITSLEYLIDKLKQVNKDTEIIRKATKIDELLEIALEKLTEDLRFDRAFIFLIEEIDGNKRFSRILGTKLNEQKLTDEVFSTASDNIITRTIKTNRPYIISSASRDDRVGEQIRELLNLQRFATVPLSSKDSTFGVVVVDQVRSASNKDKKRKVNVNDLILLNIFANQMAVTIENIKLYASLEEMAIKDGLTTLYNYRYFQQFMREEINRLKRYRDKIEDFSIILMDVDDFKHYNDTWGHQAGDEVLFTLGRIFLQESRKSDIVARYGGEEFVILLPFTPLEDARHLAERIRQRVEQYPFLHGDEQPLGKVSLSIGIAEYHQEDKNQDVIIKRADEELYRAKERGKNCISPLI
ncbi:MAG: diguanylate cyclase [bacterium]